MKKYKLLLLGIVSILSFIGFSSAGQVGTVSLKCQNSTCYLDHVYKVDFPVSSSFGTGNYVLKNCSVGVSSFTWSIDYNYGTKSQGSNNPIVVDRVFYQGTNPYIQFVFTLDSDLGYNETLTCGLYDSSPEPLLPGGKQALSGTIASLTNSFNEFIPYVIYIGIGVLSALIGFVAIKRLINRLRHKILTPFR